MGVWSLLGGWGLEMMAGPGGKTPLQFLTEMFGLWVFRVCVLDSHFFSCEVEGSGEHACVCIRENDGVNIELDEIDSWDERLYPAVVLC